MLKNININRIIKTLLGFTVLIFGTILLGVPGLSIHIISTLLGISIALEGITLALASTYPKNKGFYAFADLTFGCVFFVFGIIVIINTNITVSFMGIFVMLVAFLSLLNQGMACYERKIAGLKYGLAIAFGLIHGIFGVLIIISASKGGGLFSMVLGTYLLSLGALIITSMVYQRDDLEKL